VNLGAFAPLPNEVITLVFKHMNSARDVCALSAAARLFYCLGNDQTLWRDMCLKHYGDQVVATTNKHFIAFGKDWIWLYKSKVELKVSTGVGMKKVQNRGTLQGEWAEDQLQGYETCSKRTQLSSASPSHLHLLHLASSTKRSRFFFFFYSLRTAMECRW
jgi:hypothetical protein